MAINKKLIHFKTKAAFEAQLAGSNILDTSIVFIKDANLIWTHGAYYGKSEIYIGTNEPTNGEVVWINSDTDVIKYFDGTQWVTIVGKALPEETLIINLVSNQTNPDGNLNGTIVNVRYLDIDHKQVWEGEALSFKIPYYTTYTISASRVKGYNAEILESSITANQQTRTVTITYTKIANGIYICDNTGALTAVGSWNTSNNSSAIGVAVISDNCSFVIDKVGTSSNYPWGVKSETVKDGISNTKEETIAKTDYKGITNTDAIVAKYPSGNYAANYCRGRSYTVNGTTLYGYLGALGEWQTAYDNKSTIDSALKKIGSTAIPSIGHWASTQYSMDYAWTLNWRTGSTSSITKDNTGYRARAFYPIP